MSFLCSKPSKASHLRIKAKVPVTLPSSPLPYDASNLTSCYSSRSLCPRNSSLPVALWTWQAYSQHAAFVWLSPLSELLTFQVFIVSRLTFLSSGLQSHLSLMSPSLNSLFKGEHPHPLQSPRWRFGKILTPSGVCDGSGMAGAQGWDRGK